MKKQLNRRSNIFIYRTITASSPFIEVDLQLTPQQMSMFIHGLKYIIPCQSRLSRKFIDQLVHEQYEQICQIVKECLKDHRMSSKDERAKQAFTALENLLYVTYSKQSSSRSLQRRARREFKTIKNVKSIMQQRPDIVIRRTDKSKVFYIGKSDDFERKAHEYMIKTEAYEEIMDGHCPLADNLHAVQTLLDYLVAKKAITKQQHGRLLPNMNKVELAHFHAVPKPHKVNSLLFKYSHRLYV